MAIYFTIQPTPISYSHSLLHLSTLNVHYNKHPQLKFGSMNSLKKLQFSVPENEKRKKLKKKERIIFYMLQPISKQGNYIKYPDGRYIYIVTLKTPTKQILMNDSYNTERYYRPFFPAHSVPNYE